MRSRRGCSRGSFGRVGPGGWCGAPGCVAASVAALPRMPRHRRSRQRRHVPRLDLGRQEERGVTIAAMSLLDDYLARTPHSGSCSSARRASLPGGSTRTTVYTAPYPPYIESGAGSVAPRRRRQRVSRFPLQLHLADPRSRPPGRRRRRRGPGPPRLGVRRADRDRGPARRGDPAPGSSVERVRFTSSGTEATMFAMRAARAFTGRPLIAKFERAYHGTHDAVMTGTAGVPAAMDQLVVELPGETSTASKSPSGDAKAIWRRSSSSPCRGPAACALPSPISCHSCGHSPNATERC